MLLICFYLTLLAALNSILCRVEYSVYITNGKYRPYCLYYQDVSILGHAATIRQADQQRIAKAYLTAFFLRYLKGAVGLDEYLEGIRPVEQLEDFKIKIDAEL